MRYTYITNGVCSRKIFIELEGEKIVNVEFEGGCNGNTKGLSNMVKGWKVNDVINRIKGIRCGNKNTSCPDQLAIALERAAKEEVLLKHNL